MAILSLLVPFITCAILFIFFRNKVHIIEYLAIIGISLFIYTSYYFISKMFSELDTQYLGDYIEYVEHEDEWDEWIHKTCEEAVGKDKKGNTIYKEVDCSYRKYHSECWYAYPKNGHRFSISQKDYKFWSSLWMTQEIFIDKKRKYYRIDGDAQRYYTSKDYRRFWNITYSSTYKNPMKRSKTIYTSRKIEDPSNLYEYPKIEKDRFQNSILGYSVPDTTRRLWNSLNGYYGRIYQFRTYLIFFKNSNADVAFDQIAYWEGGNKNELLIIVGIDDNRKVQWCKTHSWSDKPVMDVNIESYISSYLGKELNINDLYNKVKSELPNWKRKEFSDFDYIDYSMSDGNSIALFIIMSLISIIGSAVAVQNDLDLMG